MSILSIANYKAMESFCRKQTINHMGYAEIENANTIEERTSKINRNSAFDCHLAPVGRQMATENTVSIDFWSVFVVFDCRLPGV